MAGIDWRLDRWREPWWIQLGSMTEIDRRLVERELASQSPQIELVTVCAVAKAAEDAASEMHGEATSIVLPLWIVEGTWATELWPVVTKGFVTQQVEDLLQGDGGAHRLIIDAGHRRGVVSSWRRTGTCR